MSVLTEVDHKAAGLALLQGNAALTVYDGRLPDAATDVTPPYVLVYTFVEWPDADPAQSLNAASGTCVVTWYCHCVGSSDYASLVVAGQVRSSLLDQRPAITGRSVDLIRMVSSLPPQRDETLRRAVMDTVVVYQLQTRPDP
jgi:hypothetical protein